MVQEQSRRRFLQVAAAGATSVGMSSVASQHSLAVPAIGGPAAVIQTGTLVIDRSDRQTWNRVSFGTSFALSPIVIVQPVTARFAPVAVRKVTRRGFEFNFSGGLDDQELHFPQRLSYVAVARGEYTMTGTSLSVEAGFMTCGHTPSTVTFDRPFDDAPVVFTQPQTTPAGEQIHRARAVTETSPTDPQSCTVRLDGPTTTNPQTVGYLAFERGTGVLDPPEEVPEELLSRYEVASTDRTLTDSWHSFQFHQRYDQPVVLVESQSNQSGSTAITHVSDLNSGGGSLRIEDGRPTRATSARTERIGYGVFENEFVLFV
ncbi:hypothetical protein [Halocatena halophila]|uniref:hypothetical protein n=1 Tax=Halocatena halophila TaxID=2814576 RepID=UPI002ED6A2E7